MARVCLLFESTFGANYYFGESFKSVTDGIVCDVNTKLPKTLYSIVSFANVAIASFGFTDATTTLNQLPQLSYVFQDSLPHMGFAKCQENFDLEDDNSHFIILFISAYTNNSTLNEIAATTAKDAGIKIVCLAFGSVFDFDTLSKWSSPGLTFPINKFVENGNITFRFKSLISCA